ncbi:hypothetical protein L6452_06425 [Arctium lappa]|uniref:Uncharacterized protein n=1 Tax=Arctium lappa TaxID=4217 RepID=A0ACB9EJT9_ARCLA|nr:hypothetical protein L6452_06425 [Arctium lappa]
MIQKHKYSFKAANKARTWLFYSSKKSTDKEDELHYHMGLTGLTTGKGKVENFGIRPIEVTRQHNEDCKKPLRIMGLRVIEVPPQVVTGDKLFAELI